MNITQKTKELFKQYRTTVNEKEKLIIRNKIFELNKKLSGAAVRKYFKGSLSTEDYKEYINCGYIGILKAIEKYNLQTKFSTYAYWYMFREFSKHQCDTQLVHIPLQKWRLRKKISKSVFEDIEFSKIEKKIIKYMSEEDKDLLNLACEFTKNYDDLIKNETDSEIFSKINKSVSIQNIINKMIGCDIKKQDILKLLIYKLENDYTLEDLRKKVFNNKITKSAVGLRIKRFMNFLKNNEELKKIWKE